MREIIIRIEGSHKYYCKLSAELEKLIMQRKNNVVSYTEYIKKMSELAEKILTEPGPVAAFCECVDGNIELAEKIDNAVRMNLSMNLRGNFQKEGKIQEAIYKCLLDASFSESEAEKITEEIFRIVLHRSEYV